MISGHHPGMLSHPMPTPPPGAAAASLPTPTRLRALHQVLDSGLLRCGVPTALGGRAGTLQQLAQGAAELGRASAAAAWVLRAQRLAIEALLQSPNVGLREHLVPDLLSGDRAGTLSLPLLLPSSAPLVGTDTGRGWRLQGSLPRVLNLPWLEFSVVAPVRLGEQAPVWVLLRSEEDGLLIDPAGDPARDPATGPACPPGCRTVTLHFNRVFFREDEWLGGADLPQRMRAVEAALAC